MTSIDENDTEIYEVVVNCEEQYSIWPWDRVIPPGWRAAGRCGSKSDCLAYIKSIWTDMRTLSLRNSMETPSGSGNP
jgi:MbtH protein